MKVVIVGANSATGQAILRCAEEAPDKTFVAAVRSDRAADEIKHLLQGNHSLVRIAYDDPASLNQALQRASAVIHVAGILIESNGSTYEKANVATVRGMVEAAKQSGVQKIVLISALNADASSSNRYYRTKGEAEDLVIGSGLCYTILRAPVLLGPETEGGAALKRNAALTKTKMIGGGRNHQQPLYVDDLARAAIKASDVSVTPNQILDLVGPVSLPEREILVRASQMLGHDIAIGSIPKSVARLGLTLRQWTGRPRFTLDVLDVITGHINLDPRPAAEALGIELTGINEMIGRSIRPSRK